MTGSNFIYYFRSINLNFKNTYCWILHKSVWPFLFFPNYHESCQLSFDLHASLSLLYEYALLTLVFLLATSHHSFHFVMFWFKESGSKCKHGDPAWCDRSMCHGWGVQISQPENDHILEVKMLEVLRCMQYEWNVTLCVERNGYVCGFVYIVSCLRIINTYIITYIS